MGNDRPGLFSQFRRGLAKTREVLGTPVSAVLRGGGSREELLRQLETALIQADVGLDVTEHLVGGLRERKVRPAEMLEALRADLLDVLRVDASESDGSPRVVFFVGVNGTGKTTTIGKLAARAKAGGDRPLLVACDTFRAAAIDQLAVWSERSAVPIVKQSPGADPAAVLHDGLSRARERGESPVLVDTAGRLHVKSHLMDELAKMVRVAGRIVDGAPHESWLVLDATVGQNGLAQARQFTEAASLTGVVMTKLDGTARGGVLLPVVRELGLPIRYAGVGEGIDDLVPFDAEAYVDGLLEGASPAAG